MKWIFATSLVLLLFLTGTAIAKSRPEFNGSYNVKVTGEWTGEGNAAVGAKNVNINVKMIDSAGNSVHLQASSLDLTDGHFAGTGKLDDATVEVTGRIENATADGSQRIVGTIHDLTHDKYGRFIGSRKKP